VPRERLGRNSRAIKGTAPGDDSRWLSEPEKRPVATVERPRTDLNSSLVMPGHADQRSVWKSRRADSNPPSQRQPTGLKPIYLPTGFRELLPLHGPAVIKEEGTRSFSRKANRLRRFALLHF